MGGATLSALSRSLLEAKKEKIKEKQDKLAKSRSKVNVPPRSQPPRDAALVAAAVSVADRSSEDECSSDSSVFSDSDSVGSGASYNIDNDLITDATDSDFHDGLTGEDRDTFKKHLGEKNVF